MRKKLSLILIWGLVLQILSHQVFGQNEASPTSNTISSEAPKDITKEVPQEAIKETTNEAPKDGQTSTSTPTPANGELDLSEDFRYDPTVGRDPFRPFRILRPSAVGSSDLIDPITLIDIDKLMVVGIIWDVKSPRAMLMERGSSGRLFTVQLNSRVGRNNGVVKAIREGEVVVIEREEIDGNTVHTAKILEINR